MYFPQTPIAVVSYDETSDVLYVKLDGQSITNSTDAPTDPELILNFNSTGQIVGIQLLGARHLTAKEWLNHPDSRIVPTLIHTAVIRWIQRILLIPSTIVSKILCDND